MDIIHRRRFFFWLMRAYFRRWTKVFLIGLIIGGALFFVARQNTTLLASVISLKGVLKVGIVGSYTTDVLPIKMQQQVSLGLTRLDESGKAQPEVAKDWEILDDGKTYIFHLRNDLYFQDGTKFTSSDVNYQFREAKLTTPDPYTLKFELNEPFSPFLTAVSRPIFKKGLIGLDGYKVASIERSDNFVKSLTLQNRQHTMEKIRYRFYPTEQAVKTAFMLGEVDQIEIQDPSEFAGWQNISLEGASDTGRLLVLLYDVRNQNLSSKQLRQALQYALPEEFDGKKRTNSPLSTASWAYKSQGDKYKHNIDTAKKLLNDSGQASGSAGLTLTIATTPKYRTVAEKVRDAWKEVGIETVVEVSDVSPSEYQILLDAIPLPPDPDQYNYWHSLQTTNLSNYGNVRIDKLLEDGRKILDEEKRLEIYADFQKYLVDDAPASFLYHPDVYTIKRK